MKVTSWILQSSWASNTTSTNVAATAASTTATPPPPPPPPTTTNNNNHHFFYSWQFLQGLWHTIITHMKVYNKTKRLKCCWTQAGATKESHTCLPTLKTITCNIRPNWMHSWRRAATCNGCLGRMLILQDICNLGPGTTKQSPTF